MRAGRWILLGLPLFLALSVIVPTLDGVRFAGAADEGHYLVYASTVAKQGPSAFPDLVEWYRSDPGNLFFPTPVRLTTIGLGAAAVRILGTGFESLQLLSLSAFLVLLILLFFGLRGLFGERTAFWTSLLVSVSPLHLAMARRALSDSLVAALSVLCLLAFARAWFAGSAPRRQWLVIAALFTLTFLAKEGMWLLIPLVLVPIGWFALRGGRPFPWVPFLSTSVLPIGAAVVLMAIASGGWEPLWETISGNLRSPASNPYALKYGQGPWFRYVLDFLLLSPLPTLLYVGWVGYLAGARVRNAHLWWWAVIPILFLVLSIPITKNIRYALLLETPIRLGAVLLLQRLLGDRDGNLKGTVGMATVFLLLVWLDLSAFYRLFVMREIYDPMSVELFTGWGLG